MNEVFLIGKIITDIKFNFIIDSKENSIARFKIKTLDKQIIDIKAYDKKADYAYRTFQKYKYIAIYGYIETNGIVVVCDIRK